MCEKLWNVRTSNTASMERAWHARGSATTRKIPDLQKRCRRGRRCGAHAGPVRAVKRVPASRAAAAARRAATRRGRERERNFPQGYFNFIYIKRDNTRAAAGGKLNQRQLTTTLQIMLRPEGHARVTHKLSVSCHHRSTLSVPLHEMFSALRSSLLLHQSMKASAGIRDPPEFAAM